MNIDKHPVVSREEWLHAREELLRKEKAFTRERDRLSAERRALPWDRIDQVYAFEGPDGWETLADLFDGRSQFDGEARPTVQRHPAVIEVRIRVDRQRELVHDFE